MMSDVVACGSRRSFRAGGAAAAEAAVGSCSGSRLLPFDGGPSRGQ